MDLCIAHAGRADECHDGCFRPKSSVGGLGMQDLSRLQTVSSFPDVRIKTPDNYPDSDSDSEASSSSLTMTLASLAIPLMTKLPERDNILAVTDSDLDEAETCPLRAIFVMLL